MTRENNHSEHIRAQNEHQHGWEHIPSNDNDEIVSPISYVSPTSTARNPPQFRRESEPEPHSSDDASAIPSKEANGPYEVEILDAAPRLKKRRFLTEWWQEMLSAMSSILCVVAIVIILYKVNGKPLADWDEPVSLNAVISVLSTAVKAGLILPVAECISQLKWIHLQSSKSQ